MIISQCDLCANLLNWANSTCRAYPAGIPNDIYFNFVSHQDPYEGDNNIRFSPRDKDCAEEIKKYEFGEPDPDSPPA